MTNYFNYELTGAGWARFSIVNENNIGIGFEFSYLADPLADLLSSLNKLHKNESSSERINFPQEPGEIFLFIKNNNANLTLEIYYHNDLTYEIDEKILNDFENIYVDKDTLSNFSLKVYQEIEKLLNNHGQIGYKEKWVEYEFPIKEYTELGKYTQSSR